MKRAEVEEIHRVDCDLEGIMRKWNINELIFGLLGAFWFRYYQWLVGFLSINLSACIEC